MVELYDTQIDMTIEKWGEMASIKIPKTVLQGHRSSQLCDKISLKQLTREIDHKLSKYLINGLW